MDLVIEFTHHQSCARRSEMKTIIAAVISIAFLMGAQVFKWKNSSLSLQKTKIIQNETRHAILSMIYKNNTVVTTIHHQCLQKE